MTTDLTPHALGLGDLAYLDSFGPLVPVKIIAAGFGHDGNGNRTDAYLTYRVTAERPGWRRGEQRAVWSSVGNRFSLVPRGSVHVRNHQYRITNNWHWEVEGERVDIF